MTLGEKIRKARTDKKITQSELCKNHITRNMLSLIESGKASPSLDTVYFLAERLDIPVPYLVSADDDLFFYVKKENIEKIKKLYVEKKYLDCINKIKTVGGLDDELSYILASSYFELGRAAVLKGSLASGLKYLTEAQLACQSTAYDTRKIESSLPIYYAIAKNHQAPLLEFDPKTFEFNINEEFDYEFYKYIMQDTAFKYTNPMFSKHLSAKSLIKERKYPEAIKLLTQIEDEKTPKTYNSYVIFAVYTDMENCYKQLGDFESAYRYASKRLSIIDGFKL